MREELGVAVDDPAAESSPWRASLVPGKGPRPWPRVLVLRHADGFHDWDHGCNDVTKCFWPAILHGVKAGSLEPDIYINMSFDDYAHGKDPAFDAILADIAASGNGGF
jgi:hypothetical protein